MRTLLIQGARAVLNAKLRFTTKEQIAKKAYSKFTEWMLNLSERRGHNITVVAVANKLARIVFVVLNNGSSYNEYKVCS